MGQVIKTQSPDEWGEGEGEEDHWFFPRMLWGEVTYSINLQVFIEHRLCARFSQRQQQSKETRFLVSWRLDSSEGGNN